MVSRQASVCPYYRTCPWRGLETPWRGLENFYMPSPDFLVKRSFYDL